MTVTTQKPMYLLGEMRENGVVWFDQNPHAHPLGTKFYADKQALTETRPAMGGSRGAQATLAALESRDAIPNDS